MVLRNGILYEWTITSQELPLFPGTAPTASERLATVLAVVARPSCSQTAQGHDHCCSIVCDFTYRSSPGFFVPVLGQLDDATLLMLGTYLFMRWSPPEVVAEHMASINTNFFSKFRPWLVRTAR